MKYTGWSLYVRYIPFKKIIIILRNFSITSTFLDHCRNPVLARPFRMYGRSEKVFGLTGFGLYAQMSQAFLPKMFVRVIPLLGGDLLVRLIHHILMWFFIIFVIVHIYLVFYHDYIERRGVTSSIIGGWKFIEEEIAAKEERIPDR